MAGLSSAFMRPRPLGVVGIRGLAQRHVPGVYAVAGVGGGSGGAGGAGIEFINSWARNGYAGNKGSSTANATVIYARGAITIDAGSGGLGGAYSPNSSAGPASQPGHPTRFMVDGAEVLSVPGGAGVSGGTANSGGIDNYQFEGLPTTTGWVAGPPSRGWYFFYRLPYSSNPSSGPGGEGRGGKMGTSGSPGTSGGTGRPGAGRVGPRVG